MVASNNKQQTKMSFIRIYFSIQFKVNIPLNPAAIGIQLFSVNHCALSIGKQFEQPVNPSVANTKLYWLFTTRHDEFAKGFFYI